MMREDHEAALERALEAVSIFPKRAWSYTVVSTIYDRMGRPEEALEYSRKALAIARATTSDDYRRRLDGGPPPSECEKDLIDSLSKEGSSGSVDEILTFLDHDDSEVVAHAATVLGDMGIQKAAGKIEELLAAEEDRRIAATLRKALARLQQERYP